jgi:hypothetical protein
VIRYALLCEHDHGFEGWFGSSEAYEDQHAGGFLECPICGSKAVRKAMMAPAVVGSRALSPLEGPPPEMREMLMQAAQAMREHVEETFDYVGKAFAEEARAMHQGETEERPIYGEASTAEVKALVEDGVPIAPLPPKRPRKREIN